VHDIPCVDEDIILPRDFGPYKLVVMIHYCGELTLAFIRCKLRTFLERTKMLKLMRARRKVYVLETRNKAAVELIEQAVKLFPEARIVNKFEDDTCNRVAYTLVFKITPRSSSSLTPLKGVFTIVNLLLT